MRYSGLQKSIDGHYIRMKWPYFQSLKNTRVLGASGAPRSTLLAPVYNKTEKV